MKKILVIFVSLIAAIAIVYGLPLLNKDRSVVIGAQIINETSQVEQRVLTYSGKLNTYLKIYDGSTFIGVIHDEDYLNSLISDYYSKYEEDFPDTKLGYCEGVNIVQESSYAQFEDIDDQIMQYLIDHSLLGIKTNAIEFSTNDGIYDIIYVKNYDDFIAARDRFLLNFVDEESLTKLSNGEKILSPNQLGSVDVTVNILEKMKRSEAAVSPDLIFKDENSIYSYLCYGRNTEREYYTVVEGDTLQGVGYHFGDMSPKQIVMLNPDVLSSVDQVIVPGMKLNVAYYTSPITVEVCKQRLAQENVSPAAPTYIEDESLISGTIEIEEMEEIGINNTLYEEKWVNGVLLSGEKLSTNVVKLPKAGVIRVGTKHDVAIGTGTFIFPVDNPQITCSFGCYFNHTGTDMINRYTRYADIYAADNGTVSDVGYREDMGNYCMIDHHNGFVTIYMHQNKEPYVNVGDNVIRGQVIGQMGNTGTSFGVHLHFTVVYNGTRKDPCDYLPCYLAED